MALTPVPEMILAPAILASTSFTSTLLDALDEYESFYFTVPKTGTIDRVHFRAGSKTSDGDGLRLRLETATETSNPPVPSGSLYGGSSEVTVTTVTASAWNRGPAGMNCSATAGNRIFVKLKSPGAGTTFNGNIASRMSNLLALNLNLPNSQTAIAVTNVSGAAVAGSAGGAIAIEYSDGTCYMISNFVPFSAAASTSFNSGSTPDEVGNKITVPCRCRVIGFVTGMTFNTNDGTCDFVLYDDADTVLLTVPWTENLNRLANQIPGRIDAGAENGVILEAGDVVRAVHKPGATNISRTVATIDTSTGGTRIRDSMPGAAIMQLTTRVNGGSWTDTADQFDGIGLLIDQIDGAPAAAAGLVGSLVHNPLVA